MKVRVTEGAKLLHDGKEYIGGDTLTLTGEKLEVMLAAGAVVEVKKKEK